LTRFASNSNQQIKFDRTRFAKLIKDSNGYPLFATQLVEKLLTSPSSPGIASSLSIIRDYTVSKIAYQSSIPVSGVVKNVNKTMIAMDKLTIDLIDHAINYLEKKISADSLQSYFDSYKASAVYQGRQMSKNISQSMSIKDYSLAESLLDQFGLRKIAQAAGLTPFGGQINSITAVCVCTGLMLDVSLIPNGDSTTMMLLWETLASPLLYLYKAPLPQSYLLGHYIEASIPCLQAPYCEEEDSSDSLLLQAGTSLP